MPTTMYDSVTAADIPTTARMVAGYVDLWSPADWARFGADVFVVRIARDGNYNGGDALDVGEGVPNSQAPGWVRMRRAAGVDPVIYTNAGNWQACRDEFARQGVPEPAWWIADYNGSPVIPAGAVAHQYLNPPGSGGHYDVSSVSPSWPGLSAWTGAATPPPPPPPITPGGTDDMTAQEYAAVVKLAYEVQGLRKALQSMGRPVPPQFTQDATDPQGFATQVNAAVSKTLDLHAVVNNVTEAP